MAKTDEPKPLTVTSPDGVENPLVIDAVGREPRLDTYVIYMFESRPWEATTERFQQLRNKVNAYVHYVKSGQMFEEYPQIVGKSFHFELQTLHPPDDQTAAFIGELQKKLAPHGVKLIVRVIDRLAAPH
jgi:hypothetical protein